MPFTPAAPITNTDLTAFLVDLARQEAATKTIANYRSDLVGFARCRPRQMMLYTYLQ